MNEIHSLSTTKSSYQVGETNKQRKAFQQSCLSSKDLSLALAENIVNEKTFKLLCARRWKSQHIEGWSSGVQCKHLQICEMKKGSFKVNFIFIFFSA